MLKLFWIDAKIKFVIYYKSCRRLVDVYTRMRRESLRLFNNNSQATSKKNYLNTCKIMGFDYYVYKRI